MIKLTQAATGLLVAAALSLLAAPIALAQTSRSPTTVGGDAAPFVLGPHRIAASPAVALPLGAVEPTRAASLESAASKAGETGRKVAMSLIGLAFAIAAIVLAFRRDFKEAAGVFAVGLLAVLLATPAGVSLLKDTVKALVG